MAKSKKEEKRKKSTYGELKKEMREKEREILRERERKRETQRTNNSGLTRENILSLAIERESNLREDVME